MLNLRVNKFKTLLHPVCQTKTYFLIYRFRNRQNLVYLNFYKWQRPQVLSLENPFEFHIILSWRKNTMKSDQTNCQIHELNLGKTSNKHPYILLQLKTI